MRRVAFLCVVAVWHRAACCVVVAAQRKTNATQRIRCERTFAQYKYAAYAVGVAEQIDIVEPQADPRLAWIMMYRV